MRISGPTAVLVGMVVAVGALFVPSIILTQTFPFEQHTLGGRVLDDETGEPIDLARVVLQGMSVRLETMTDARGEFFFESITGGAGTYTVTVYAEGYAVGRQAADVLARRTTNIPGNATSMASVNNLLIRLKRHQEHSGARTAPAVSARQLQIPGRARKAFRKGLRELYDRNKPQSSLKHFHEAVDLYPAYDDAYAQLGMAYLLLNQLDQARQVLEQANQVYPDNSQAHALLGKVLLKLGQTGEAVQELRRALQLNETAWHVHLDLGRTLLEQGQVEAAFPHARRAHELNPTSMNAHLLYYNACAQRHNYAAALEELDEFVKLYPDTKAASQMRALRERLRQTVKAEAQQ